MKQKVLTEKQHEILGRLEAILKEAQENNIGFVFDEDDCSLTAFNVENVELSYCGRSQEDDNDEEIDWDSVSIIDNFKADYFNSGWHTYFLHFKEE